MSAFNPSWIEQQLKRAPTVVIDVAAFDGRHSKTFKSAFPYCRVIAVEPNPDSLHMLRHHCDGNSGIEMHHYAVCGGVGEISYYGSYSDFGDSASGSIYKPKAELHRYMPHLKFKPPVTVPAITIQALCVKLGIEHIDVLHTWLLGAEGDIILGLGHLRPSIIHFRSMPHEYYDGALSKDRLDLLMTDMGYVLKMSDAYEATYVLVHESDVVSPVIPGHRSTVRVKPLLSILTPTIPTRLPVLASLVAKIEGQIGDLPIEHLWLGDNKFRSIGLKRDALVRAARGTMCAFLDDDDDCSGQYCHEIVAAIQAHPDVDVIVFNQACYLNSAEPFTVRFGLEYENQQAKLEHNKYIDITRKPFPCCVWRTALAQKYEFPDQGWNEDHLWCERLWSEAKTQHRIDKTLHVYRFNEKTSEGPQTIEARKEKQYPGAYSHAANSL